jgi:Ca2+-binding RTX toxin-like protein
LVTSYLTDGVDFSAFQISTADIGPTTDTGSTALLRRMGIPAFPGWTMASLGDFPQVTYATDDLIYFNGSSQFLALTGGNLGVSGTTATGGPITGIELENGGMIGLNMAVSGFNAAAATASSTDDLAWFRSALAGDDFIGISLMYGRASTFFGAAGHDRLIGGRDIDSIQGNSGNDTLEGRGGADQLSGGSGNDAISGDGANDNLSGGTGADMMSGGGGRDILTGGAGADILDGGAGRDTLTGNGGADLFVFATASHSGTGANSDRIIGFGTGTDQLDLTAIDADVVASGQQVLAFSNSTPTANSVWFVVSGGDTIVRADINSDTTADMAIRLVGFVGLTGGDFV